MGLRRDGSRGDGLRRDGLRRGWTTGACAQAAAKAAFYGLFTGSFPEPVRISLPKIEASFSLACKSKGNNWAQAGVIKDAGDDPDVTDKALIISRIDKLKDEKGIYFAAGVGVGVVSKPGLQLGVGEAAINPWPRRLISEELLRASQKIGVAQGLRVTISVPQGQKMAPDTWNEKLGIIGGISILGSSGVVVPYSCSAWISSIYRAIDVAYAMGFLHIALVTGKASQRVAQESFAEDAIIEIGDFAGGVFKYLRRQKFKRITLIGGFAKMIKFGQKNIHLHSSRSQIDFNELSLQIKGDKDLARKVKAASSAGEVISLLSKKESDLADIIALKARKFANSIVGMDTVDVVVTDIRGKVLSIA